MPSLFAWYDHYSAPPGGGGGAGGHGGAAHHAPQRQGPHPGLRPGGKAHRPPDGGLGGEGHGLTQSYEDLAWAAAYGYETDRLEDLAWELGGFDLVVNTIPAPVLDERRLRWVDPGAFLLDLASAPGGIDRAAAQRRNLQVLQAPGLPGRVAPVTAAAAIRDAVYHILWEQEA